MHLSRRVLWKQGLFLVPQHLQQQELAFDDAVSTAWQMGQMHGHGVWRLRFREPLDGRVGIDVLDLQAVTPDGTFVSAGPEARHRVNAAIEYADAPANLRVQTAGVFLALAREERDIQAVSDPAAGPGTGPTRFVASFEALRDRYDVGQLEERHVELLSYRLRVHVIPDDEGGRNQVADLSRRNELLRIARLKREGERYVVDRSYFPPSLRLDAVAHDSVADAGSLLGRIVRLSNLIAGQIDGFASEKRDRGMAMDLTSSQNLPMFLVLATLYRQAATFRQFAEQERVHPATVYFHLRQAVAELAAFSAETDYLGGVNAASGGQVQGRLPPYDHDDIGHVFDEAIRCLKRLLDALSMSSAMSIELEFDGRSTWTADVPDEFFDGRSPGFFVVVESALSNEDVDKRLNDRKIGPSAEMSDLIDRRIEGLRIDYRRYPPPQLPQRSDRYTYYEVDQDHIYWGRIKRHRNIQLFCPELVEESVRVKLVKTVAER